MTRFMMLALVALPLWPQIVEATSHELLRYELLPGERRIAEEVREVVRPARWPLRQETIDLTFVRGSNHNS